MSAISGNLSKLISVYYLNEKVNKGSTDPSINPKIFNIQEFKYE
nr:MAG TPA: hypothetical protein [Caudoviricetes sp.]